MNRLLMLLCIGLLFCGSMQAQKNPRIDKKAVLLGAPDKEKAQKEFSNAEKYYRKGQGTYDEALKYYIRLYRYKSDDAALNYKIGICYLGGSDKKKALKYMLESKPAVAKDYFLALGKAYQFNLMFDEAKQAFGDYYNTLGRMSKRDNVKRLDQLKRECSFGRFAVKDSVPVFITNLGPLINTYYDDYGAIETNFGLDTLLYFTSKRPKEEPNKRVSRFKYKERVLYSNYCVNQPCSDVTAVKNLKNVNNSLAGVDTKNKRIFYYGGKYFNGSIYSADVKKTKAKKKRLLGGRINHVAFKETTISIADDGSTYFVSDRRGGKGGKDIWYCKQKKANKFKKLKNLGHVINTPFDEECVYVTPDGNTLYFSSNGHDGMGGFDVFRSEKRRDGSWGLPENLGYPINTPSNELFYRPTSDSLVALYASVRESGFGGLDIYKIVTDTRIPFTLSGIVTDVASGDTLPGTVSVFNKLTNEMIASVSVDSLDARYHMSFEDIGNYAIQADAPGYGMVTDSVMCPLDRSDAIEMDFQLTKLKYPFTISGFARDSATHAPLFAEINFYDEEGDSLLVRQMTNASTGYYSVTLADKYKVLMEIKSENYFSQLDSFDAKLMSDTEIEKTFDLVSSKVFYSIKGKVVEEDSKEPVAATIYFYRPGNAIPVNAVRSDTISGNYALVMEDMGPFAVEIRAEGYFFSDDFIQFPDKDSLSMEKDFTIKKMKTGAKIVVENILFSSGKSTLLPSSYPELNKLATLLITNPEVRIEVSGHTDNVGSAAINKKLSKARALSVRNYLVGQGVEQERMEYEGYGFDQPIAPNTTQDGRAQNRRVEIKVLE